MAAPRLTLVVDGVDDCAPGIRTVRLSDPSGAPLPSFTPGSNLVIECGTVSNAYSLTGDSVTPDHYAISVLKIEDGHGGSCWIHGLNPGDTVEALAPRSAFAPILSARRHLLIAGGIGVTPIVSHLRSAARWGREVEVVYAHRPGGGAYLPELAELAGPEHLRVFTDRNELMRHVRTALADQPMGTHLYTCGPAGFMDAIVSVAAELGWPASRIHLEHFGAPDLDPGEPFEVTIGTTGRTLDVPSGVSLLEALEKQGHEIANLCRQGVCGECRIPVRAGTPLHRDLFLSDDEKSANDSMMCCVSRATGDHLEIDLP